MFGGRLLDVRLDEEALLGHDDLARLEARKHLDAAPVGGELRDPAIVFYIGAAVATVSLSLSLLVPRHPVPGRETTLVVPAAAAAE